jgi:sucrose-6-phosphate hydrolase SacC (GH32 family)
MALTALLTTLLTALAANPEYCPRFHTILGHYDPSGPILLNGTWHVFPDGGGVKSAWSHFTSTDLLRWTAHVSNAGAHDTGSVSFDPSDCRGVVLFPDGHGHLLRQTPNISGTRGSIALNVTWTKPHTVFTVNRTAMNLGVGFRDPARALLLPDGNFYVAVGSGFGGDNENTGLPANGTGCIAWLRATNSSLTDFTFLGCLLENNRTTGHMNPSTIAWNSTDLPAAFMECPDIFPLSAASSSEEDSAEKNAEQTFVAIASLYNWKEGAYFSNEWWSGTISSAGAAPKFIVNKRGLLDFGQYYAARSGGGVVQRGDGRRVLFSATGWHNTKGWPGGLPCKTQMHLIPRDLGLDASGRLTIAPVAEVAATLRNPKTPAAGGMLAVATGVQLDLEMNCSGTPTRGGDEHPIVGMAVLDAKQGGGVVVGYNYTSQSLIVQGGGNNQGAPLADLTHGGGGEGGAVDDAAVSLRVLIDGALLESFLNHHVAISSLVTNVFRGTAPPGPENRTSTALTPPAGVTCTFAAYKLDAIHAPWG